MTVENPVKYEVELVERLWSQGWSAFRTNSSGPGALANCDVIAMRNGVAFIANVVPLVSGTSTSKVNEDNKDLIKIKRRADPTVYRKGGDVIIGHAIKKDHEDAWYYATIDKSKVYGSRDYDTLNEVLED